LGGRLVDRFNAIAFKGVLALGFVSFFTDISSEMCFSLLPTFIISLPGATKAVLGVIEGLAETLNYVLRLFSGVISDRFRRRKPIILAGYTASNLAKPFFSAAQTWVDALLIRVFDRVGKGMRTPPRDALLSELASKKRMGTMFGIHRTLDQLGAILGPILASLLITLGLTARSAFLLSLVPGSMAILILLFLVEERTSRPSGGVKALRGIRIALKGGFLQLLLVVGVFSMGAFNFAFILLRAKEVGVPEALIPMVYAVINAVYVATAIPAGALFDRIGGEKALALGYALFLLSLLLLPLKGVPYAFLVASVYGSYLGVVETVQRALIPSYVQSDLSATAYGLYYLIVGLAFLVANVTVGALWEYLGLLAVVSYSVVTSAVAIVGALLLVK